MQCTSESASYPLVSSVIAYLKQPTPQQVEAYVKIFDDPASQTGKTYIALTKLFTTYPDNLEFGDIYLKVAALNSMYGTNIYAIFRVAQLIYDLQIDPGLNAHDPDLVEAIARVQTSNGKIRRNYSFATKYCSWHRPKEFPIYDSYVDGLLWLYAQHNDFFGGERFHRAGLWNNYQIFTRVFLAFRDYFSLQETTIRQIDKFLWLYGQELWNSPQ